MADEHDESMRAKQLIASVRQGRRIRIDILDEGWFDGYLAGWDKDTYFLLSPDDAAGKVEKYLIPKPNILAIQLVDEKTFREEEQYPKMAEIVDPFKLVLNKTYPRA